MEPGDRKNGWAQFLRGYGDLENPHDPRFLQTERISPYAWPHSNCVKFFAKIEPRSFKIGATSILTKNLNSATSKTPKTVISSKLNELD